MVVQSNLVVAMTQSRVIGKDGNLPWHIPEDLKLFKEITQGKVVLMGRKTLDSIVQRIGKPLPQRINVAVGTTPYRHPDLYVCSSFDEGMAKAFSFGPEVCIIGGASIYAQALPIVDKLSISYVKKDYPGDTFFPDFNPGEWIPDETRDFKEFTFMSYNRLSPVKSTRKGSQESYLY